jgi:hypothetical protein
MCCSKSRRCAIRLLRLHKQPGWDNCGAICRMQTPAARTRPRSFWRAAHGEIETVFDRTQLRDSVYSSYTALLHGRIKDPPPQRIVLRIAEYLECDVWERDDLLLAAGQSGFCAVI